MENQAVKVEVNSRVSYLDQISKGCLVKVVIVQEVEQFLLDQNDGTNSSMGTYPSSSQQDHPLISLHLQNFSRSHVYQRLHSKLNDPLLSRLVSKKICVQAQGRDLSQGSFLMIISVNVTQKEYLNVPSGSALSTATTVLDDESCAICLENLLESKTNPICQLPNCTHMFHERCLTQWLGRQEQSSCPLCRQVVLRTWERFYYG